LPTLHTRTYPCLTVGSWTCTKRGSVYGSRHFRVLHRATNFLPDCPVFHHLRWILVLCFFAALVGRDHHHTFDRLVRGSAAFWLPSVDNLRAPLGSTGSHRVDYLRIPPHSATSTTHYIRGYTCLTRSAATGCCGMVNSDYLLLLPFRLIRSLPTFGDLPIFAAMRTLCDIPCCLHTRFPLHPLFYAPTPATGRVPPSPHYYHPTAPTCLRLLVYLNTHTLAVCCYTHTCRCDGLPAGYGHGYTPGTFYAFDRPPTCHFALFRTALHTHYRTYRRPPHDGRTGCGSPLDILVAVLPNLRQQFVCAFGVGFYAWFGQWTSLVLDTTTPRPTTGGPMVQAALPPPRVLFAVRLPTLVTDGRPSPVSPCRGRADLDTATLDGRYTCCYPLRGLTCCTVRW